MRLLVGVDGGGTRTRAALTSVDGGQTIVVETGPSRLTLIGIEACTKLLVDLLTKGAEQLGGQLKDIISVSICLSGVDSSQQSAELQKQLVPWFETAEIEVMNDAFSVLSAGTLGKTGLAVIGGTGSIAVGERADGTVARAGGYGSVLGDEGSGFDIGRQGLAAAIRGFEGRGPKTELWEHVARQYDVSHPIDLVDEIYEHEQQVTKVAAFAPYVLKCASSDQVASDIVEGAAASYVELILSVRRQLQENFQGHVVLSGGLFQAHDILRERLQKLLPADRLETLQRPPVFGALMRAVDQAKQVDLIVKDFIPMDSIGV